MGCWRLSVCFENSPELHPPAPAASPEKLFWMQWEMTTPSCGGACCWWPSPELAALHGGWINSFCKAFRNLLGGSRGGRVVFNIILLLCYHNDCFERFDLLFFKEIFYLICRKPPRGGGRTLSSERLPVTAQSRDKPLFYFASLPALQADDSKGFKTSLSLHFRGKTLGLFSCCDLQEVWHIP